MMKKCGCCNSRFKFNGAQLVQFISGFQLQRIALFSTDSKPCLSDYLVGSLGFSKQQSLATSAKLFKWKQPSPKSKRVSDSNFSANADSVISFLKQHGFDETHLRKIVCYDPRVLTAKIDKTLKPKMEILQDLGFTGSHLVSFVVGNPRILKQRLEPGIQALRDVLGTDDSVGIVLKRWRRSCLSGVTKNLRANVAVLENKYGISKDIIRKHVVRNPNLYMQRLEWFRVLLDRAENKLGIPRDSSMFLYGFKIAALTDENFEAKCQVLKSFGWTESDVMQLIRKMPYSLILCPARIKSSLEFLMTDLVYEPAYLASHPALLGYSLKKRVFPRHRILLALKEKGLIQKDYPLYNCLCLTDSQFFEKFVLPHEEVHEFYAKETGCCVEFLTRGVDNH